MHQTFYSNLFWRSVVGIAKNHWSHLDSAAIWKIWKRHFLGKVSKSCYWVTLMGLKPPQKNLFENVSTNKAARGFQSFGLLEGNAFLPSK